MCQLANYALETFGRTLVLSLERCDRTPQFSDLSLSGGSSAYIIASTSRAQYDWLRLTFIILFTNLAAIALYNNACYNTEILVKLLAFLFKIYKRFLFLSFFTFLTFLILMWTFFRHIFCHRGGAAGVRPNTPGQMPPLTDSPGQMPP